MADLFHKEFRELTQEEKDLMAIIKDKAQELHDLFDKIQVGDNREKGRPVSVAKTELESSVMWAVKGLTA